MIEFVLGFASCAGVLILLALAGRAIGKTQDPGEVRTSMEAPSNAPTGGSLGRKETDASRMISIVRSAMAQGAFDGELSIRLIVIEDEHRRIAKSLGGEG